MGEAFFKAHDWREVVDLAESSEDMKEAVVTLRELSEDEKVKLECLGRIRYNGDMSSAKEQGIQLGIELINWLNQRLIADGCFDDMERTIKDPAYQQKLIAEYKSLSDTES